jgi:hypothetical protein
VMRSIMKPVITPTYRKWPRLLISAIYLEF